MLIIHGGVGSRLFGRYGFARATPRVVCTYSNWPRGGLLSKTRRKTKKNRQFKACDCNASQAINNTSTTNLDGDLLWLLL